jgi:hypothetical protein
MYDSASEACIACEEAGLATTCIRTGEICIQEVRENRTAK